MIVNKIADKAQKYGTLVIVGYALQVLAIPALALVPRNGWMVACGLAVLERIGKAIKKPVKNTLVSFAASEVGTGKGFAYLEFLDQLGVFLGPAAIAKTVQRFCRSSWFRFPGFHGIICTGNGFGHRLLR